MRFKSSIITQVKDDTVRPDSATHCPPVLRSRAASCKAQIPRPNASTSGNSDSKLNTRIGPLPGDASSRHMNNGADKSAMIKLALAMDDATGGNSCRRARKFLHGPHRSVPCNVTRQSLQKASPHSEQAA